MFPAKSNKKKFQRREHSDLPKQYSTRTEESLLNPIHQTKILKSTKFWLQRISSKRWAT